MRALDPFKYIRHRALLVDTRTYNVRDLQQKGLDQFGWGKLHRSVRQTELIQYFLIKVSHDSW